MSDTEKIVTPEDYELFIEIAKDIKANPAKYMEAGKWLDEYCSEDAYWQRQKDNLNKLQAQIHTLPVELDTKRLKKEFEVRRTPAFLIRFQEAKNSLIEKYEDQQFIPEDDGKCIILITWLLTDPDAEKSNFNITQIEKWSWEPMDDVTKMSRGYASFLCFHGGKVYGPWMNLVRIAWSKLAEGMDGTVSSSAEFSKQTSFMNFLNNLLRASIKHLPFCGPFLYDVIYGTLDSQAVQKKTIRQTKSSQSGLIFERQEPASKYKADVEKWYQNRTIQAALIGAAVLLLVSIIGWLIILYINKPKADSGEIETIPSENKLSLSLKELCQDIDSRPPMQREDTAKTYIGIRVENERLILFDAQKIGIDQDFRLTMMLPEEWSGQHVIGRYIIFSVKKEKYPELVAAKEGLDIYVSGRIEYIGPTYINLSEVLLGLE